MGSIKTALDLNLLSQMTEYISEPSLLLSEYPIEQKVLNELFVLSSCQRTLHTGLEPETSTVYRGRTNQTQTIDNDFNFLARLHRQANINYCSFVDAITGLTLPAKKTKENQFKICDIDTQQSFI
ncbi:Hypothetical predicted protein [Paramuricea clavata]|uniref:Uncharacterized protein n=1 Tax=Paramuricea clavata TaxID=317549 RepID=A0A6S7G2C3_PARCT|nr:Hypothetical predicted protein [Paramuricea clavata]